MRAIICAIAVAYVALSAASVEARNHRLQHVLQQRAGAGAAAPMDEFECGRNVPDEGTWLRVARAGNFVPAAATVGAALKMTPRDWTEYDKRGNFARVAYIDWLIADFKANSPNPGAQKAFEQLEQCMWYHQRERLRLNADALSKVLPVITQSRNAGVPEPDAPVYREPRAPADPALMPSVRFDSAKYTSQHLRFNEEPAAHRGAPWTAIKSAEQYAAINALPLVVASGTTNFPAVQPPATFLPSQAGACTWTVLADKAQVFATTPMSGGSVYIAEGTKGPLMIHAIAPAGAKHPQQMMDECAERVLKFAGQLQRDSYRKSVRVDRVNPAAQKPNDVRFQGYNPDGDALFAVSVYGVVTESSPNGPPRLRYEAVLVVDPKDPAAAKTGANKIKSSERRSFYPWAAPTTGK